MRILLTRPEADAQRSAARLAALGHEPVLAPLFDIVATGAPLPAETPDRLLATSAHAFDFLPPGADALKALQLHLVGERTAARARESGFAQIDMIAADAKALAVAIARARLAPQAFLYLAGRERRPELEAALAALGHRVTPWTLYDTRESPDALARLSQVWRDGVDAVLHFSPRSAALYVALADRAGLREAALAPIQIAISPRTAQNIVGAADLRIAPTPDFEGLLSRL